MSYPSPEWCADPGHLRFLYNVCLTKTECDRLAGMCFGPAAMAKIRRDHAGITGLVVQPLDLTEFA